MTLFQRLLAFLLAQTQDQIIDKLLNIQLAGDFRVVLR